jgi:hypothetical protein
MPQIVENFPTLSGGFAMKRTLLVVASLLILFSVAGFAQFAITIDAARDGFYDSQAGPEEGHIYLPPQALSADVGTGEPIDDVYDLSANCWLAWDDDYLYFYTEVWDDYILVNNATSWENDAVELKIDPDPSQQTTEGIAAVRLTALGADQADNPAGVDNLVNGNELDEAWTPVEGEDYIRLETVLGYNIEFRLPFNVIVRAGKYVDNRIGGIMGLGINLLESDSDHAECTLTWSAGMSDLTWSNPQLLGTATFLEGNKIKLEAVNAAGGDAKMDSTQWFIPPATGIEMANTGAAPSLFELEQNYPNPFNPATTISYSLDKTEHIALEVYDLLGHKISTLYSGVQNAGRYTATWNALDDDGRTVSSGLYICRLAAGSRVKSGKMTLMK